MTEIVMVLDRKQRFVHERKARQNMRLSEAIRKGSEGRPQARGRFIDTLTGPVQPVCALGAAVLAAFPDTPLDPQRLGETSVHWLTALQWEMSDWDNCPEDDECDFDGSLEDMVVHLNDDHQWSFGDIADWAERLEQSGLTP